MNSHRGSPHATGAASGAHQEWAGASADSARDLEPAAPRTELAQDGVLGPLLARELQRVAAGRSGGARYHVENPHRPKEFNS